MKKLLTIFCLLILSSYSYSEGRVSDEEVHKWIIGVVKELNKDLPMNIDENTTLYSIRVGFTNKRRVVYLYKLTNIDSRIDPIDIQRVKNTTQLEGKNYYCSQPVTREVRNQGVSVEYNYSDQKNNFLFSFELFPSDCETIDVINENLILKQGLRYEKNSSIPFTGKSVTYHDNGQISSKRNYKNGRHSGLFEEFYETGQLEFRGVWSDRKQEGLHEGFYENGLFSYRKNWKNGKRHGLYETFFESGDKQDYREYKEGEIDGVWESNNVSGTWMVHGECKEGMMDGLWTYWWGNTKEDKEITKSEWYVKGKMIHKKTSEGSKSWGINKKGQPIGVTCPS